MSPVLVFFELLSPYIPTFRRFSLAKSFLPGPGTMYCGSIWVACIQYNKVLPLEHPSLVQTWFLVPGTLLQPV